MCAVCQSKNALYDGKPELQLLANTAARPVADTASLGPDTLRLMPLHTIYDACIKGNMARLPKTMNVLGQVRGGHIEEINGKNGDVMDKCIFDLVCRAHVVVHA